MRAVLLDNEAVTALADPTHRKHRLVIAHLAAVTSRRRRGASTRLLVATAVRVGAAWDRSDSSAAAINRFRIDDSVLDTASANTAARIASRTGVGVADAHLGAVIHALDSTDIVVLTSDPTDMTRGADPVRVRAVRI